MVWGRSLCLLCCSSVFDLVTTATCRISCSLQCGCACPSLRMHVLCELKQCTAVACACAVLIQTLQGIARLFGGGAGNCCRTAVPQLWSVCPQLLRGGPWGTVWRAMRMHGLALDCEAHITVCAVCCHHDDHHCPLYVGCCFSASRLNHAGLAVRQERPQHGTLRSRNIIWLLGGVNVHAW